ncbi:hypothetical protein JRO89_XS01G0056700 [Xanthoceras sorbifolium]|uniref:DUF4371 domain-containing protein n=1 Tax=Xanthoceras sorbifolium TaxID=99658 RepID=A0ABQ8IIC0_9ROSI|nr:hypothetical protein JRO89_XS01G0056700 [Xanthoceras sorbifolium]
MLKCVPALKTAWNCKDHRACLTKLSLSSSGLEVVEDWIQNTCYLKNSKKKEKFSFPRGQILVNKEKVMHLLYIEQRLAFRGQDEYKNSSNPGNFLRLLEFLGDHNEDIKAVTLVNAPENMKLTSPNIQKDIICACLVETTNVIINEMGDALFSVSIDESRDMSSKEQMDVVFHFVNKSGHVIECFIDIKHVNTTISLSLKKALDDLLSGHGLTLNNGELLSGQGQNQESNVKRFGDARWGSHYVSDFCDNNHIDVPIDVPNMDNMFLPWACSQRKAPKVTNIHHCRVELFNTVLDMQLQELNNRFNEASSKLLLYLACLSPNDSFSSFDKQKLVKLAKFYPKEFFAVEILAFEVQF